MIRALIVCAVLCAACKSESGPTDETLDTPTGSARTGSAGGFSASLHAELAGEGSDGAGSAGTAIAPSSGSAGSAATGSAATGSAATRSAGTGSASSGSGASASIGSAGSGSTGSGAARAMGTGSGSAAVAASPPGPGSAAVAKAGSAAPVSTSAGSAAATPVPSAKAGTAAATAPKPVATSAELQAIKLSLLPNWDRDTGEPGTFSLFVKVQSRDESALFKFHYGYDDPRAPVDRDAYKKFLADSKIFNVTADRQRGAAWYLEGTDPSGRPAFRMLVTYGGKRLVCYGSLYKDSGFGDIRDEVVIQAKKICETIQL
jgi:hypothetical protein